MKGLFLILLLPVISMAQGSRSRVWVSDNGDGTYTNPVIHADYSDPDAIRVGDDFYMISSSFNHVPGLPILHSKDLVNWTIIGHALTKLVPEKHFDTVQHGNGVWAPSIRYHDKIFYIYYPDPDYGIYLIRAKDIRGPWSEPVLVQGGKGLIDPCPLWDEDGRVYLVHAFANSRAGIKSILVVKELNKEGTQVISDSVRVYDGHVNDPTIEGPKFYKRHGYYYIFAPAGGVPTGWQLVLRSRNVYGPYERKVVMDQGTTPVNGPHQGAWVDTKSGEDWFLHFQDKGAYGRIVHLQPMKWINDWPVIGMDKDGDGKGEPVIVYKKPDVGKNWPISTPAESDEFNEGIPGPQWQWQANHNNFFNPVHKGYLCLRGYPLSATEPNLYNDPALLMQKFPAEEFTSTTKVNLDSLGKAQCGLIVFGLDYAGISVSKSANGFKLSYAIAKNADKKSAEKKSSIELRLPKKEIYLRVSITKGANCSFGYSMDGKDFRMLPESFVAREGKWVGAKVGIFCLSNIQTARGYALFDWFRIEK